LGINGWDGIIANYLWRYRQERDASFPRRGVWCARREEIKTLRKRELLASVL
jgi:hypothetical protein